MFYCTVLSQYKSKSNIRGIHRDAFRKIVAMIINLAINIHDSVKGIIGELPHIPPMLVFCVSILKA